MGDWTLRGNREKALILRVVVVLCTHCPTVCGVTQDLFLFSGRLCGTRAEVSLVARVNDAVNDSVPHS